jgi:hypothetical protein
MTWGTKMGKKRCAPAEGGEEAKFVPVLLEAEEKIFQLHLGAASVCRASVEELSQAA